MESYLEFLILIIDFEDEFSVYELKVMIYGLYVVYMCYNADARVSGVLRRTYECVKWKQVLE